MQYIPYGAAVVYEWASLGMRLSVGHSILICLAFAGFMVWVFWK